MDDFVFPSDQDRAESPEMDRVCRYLEDLMESRSGALAEGTIHKVAKRYLNKRQQGFFMGEIREAMYGYNDRAPRPMSDCCCGETEEAWRLCPLHKNITSTETEGPL